MSKRQGDKSHKAGRGAGAHVERTPQDGIKKSPNDAPLEMGAGGANEERAVGEPMGDRHIGQYTDAGEPGLQNR
jgi:hypothetical protein